MTALSRPMISACSASARPVGKTFRGEEGRDKAAKLAAREEERRDKQTRRERGEAEPKGKR